MIRDDEGRGVFQGPLHSICRVMSLSLSTVVLKKWSIYICYPKIWLIYSIYSIYFGNKLGLHLNDKYRVFGSIWGLLSGHWCLQYHLYVLDLTFSPTCICLTGDETSQHYSFDCPLYNSVLRPDNQLMVLNWYDVANCMTKSGKTP